MARLRNGPHEPSPTGTTSDYLFQLRCDETSGGLTDALGVRSMTTVTGTVGSEQSAMQDNPTSGARTLFGIGSFSRATFDADSSIFQESAGGWGFACWCIPRSFSSEQSIIEFGERSSPETQATNVQMRVSITTTGDVRLSWEHDVGTNRNNSTTNGVLGGNAWVHIGVRMMPDPDNLGTCQVDFFVNGQNVDRYRNRPWPNGGTSSRWVVGASRELGSAVGTFGAFLDGGIDDMILAKFPPDVAWFRKLYSDGIRDFAVREEDPNVWADAPRAWTTHARVLVRVPATDTLSSPPGFTFSFINKVDLEWIDLSNVNGIDFVETVSWSDSVDDFISTGQARLFRNFYFYNTSPFSSNVSGTDNPFVDPLSSVGHLLSAMRQVRIETATVPYGMSKSDVGPHWEVQFDGFMRSFNVSDDSVEITIADKGSAIMDVFIEPNRDGKDRTYGTGAGTAVEAELQQIIDDNDPSVYEALLVSSSGSNITVRLHSTTAASDINGKGKPNTLAAGDQVILAGTGIYDTPAGSVDTILSRTATLVTLTRTSATVSSVSAGTLTTTASFSYLGGKPKVWTPVSSLWNVYQWNEPASKGVLKSIDDVMSQIGWRARFRWDELRQEFRLTVFNPAASSSVFRGDAGIVGFGIVGISRLSSSVEDVRNVWVIEYPSSSFSDPRLNRLVLIVSAVSPSSARSYGRRYARVRVGSDSLVNRSTEAQALANTALSDLATPVSEVDVDMLFDRRLQVQDSLQIDAEELIAPFQIPSFFGDDVKGSVVKVSHSISRESQRTTASVRKMNIVSKYVGPVGRVDRYDDIISQAGSVAGRGLSPVLSSGIGPSIDKLGILNAVRTIRVAWPHPSGDLTKAYLETEVHQSTVSGFTPSSSTLVGVVRGTSTMVTGMAAGTFFVRVVHCDRMGNRSDPSPETSYTY